MRLKWLQQTAIASSVAGRSEDRRYAFYVKTILDEWSIGHKSRGGVESRSAAWIGDRPSFHFLVSVSWMFRSAGAWSRIKLTRG